MYANTQGLYRLFDPKLKTFCTLFPKQYIFFPDLEKCMNKAFAWCTANTWPRLNKTLLKGKKITSKELVVALKKKT